jgi:hypothetical protein
MKVRFAAGASDDADEHVDWYEARNSGLGNEFLAKLIEFRDRIGSFPQLYERIHPSPKGRDVRRGTLSLFPYEVVYEVRAEEIVYFPSRTDTD